MPLRHATSQRHSVGCASFKKVEILRADQHQAAIGSSGSATQRGTAQHVFELTDVARPVRRDQSLPRLGQEADRAESQTTSRLIQEVRGDLGVSEGSSRSPNGSPRGGV